MFRKRKNLCIFVVDMTYTLLVSGKCDNFALVHIINIYISQIRDAIKKHKKTTICRCTCIHILCYLGAGSKWYWNLLSTYRWVERCSIENRISSGNHGSKS